jgi:hypothetical protein
MRDDAIVVLVAVSLITISDASARDQAGLHPAFEHSLHEPLLAQSTAPWGDSVDDLKGRRTGNSARMITWSCSAPSSGSALSIYSIHGQTPRLRPASAMRDDVHSDLCADDDDE